MKTAGRNPSRITSKSKPLPGQRLQNGAMVIQAKYDADVPGWFIVLAYYYTTEELVIWSVSSTGECQSGSYYGDTRMASAGYADRSGKTYELEIS